MSLTEFTSLSNQAGAKLIPTCIIKLLTTTYFTVTCVLVMNGLWVILALSENYKIFPATLFLKYLLHASTFRTVLHFLRTGKSLLICRENVSSYG